MNRLACAVVFAFLSASLSFGQVTITGVGSVRTGFAVVTPLFGGGTGLNVSEMVSGSIAGNFVQTSVLPSPPITFTSVVVNFDTRSGVNTAIAIVNPNNGAAAVSLSLTDQRGVPALITNMTIGGGQQVSRFATELFAGLPGFAGPFAGQLFVSSNVPIGVLGLAFNGSSFTSLPVATQSNSTGPSATPFSLVGRNGVLLSQIATGGGWESRITIANTSPVPQVIRIDFFDSQGGPLALPIGSSVPSVTVPAGGVVSFSTTS